MTYASFQVSNEVFITTCLLALPTPESRNLEDYLQKHSTSKRNNTKRTQWVRTRNSLVFAYQWSLRIALRLSYAHGLSALHSSAHLQPQAICHRSAIRHSAVWRTDYQDRPAILSIPLTDDRCWFELAEGRVRIRLQSFSRRRMAQIRYATQECVWLPFTLVKCDFPIWSCELHHSQQGRQ